MNKYLRVYFTLAKIGWKENKEYPINVIMGVIGNFTLAFVMLFFYFILGDLAKEIIVWENIDFALFFFSSFATSIALRLFVQFRFKEQLTNGKMVNYLFRPIHPYIFASTHNLRGSILFHFYLFSIITLVFLLIFRNEYNNFLLGFFSMLLGFMIHVILLNVIYSICFFSKNLGDSLFKIYYKELNTEVEVYTPKFFENSPFGIIIFLLPISFSNYFFVEILKGRFEQFYYYLPYFLIFGLICFIILIIQWKKGLEKYETFG